MSQAVIHNNIINVLLDAPGAMHFPAKGGGGGVFKTPNRLRMD